MSVLLYTPKGTAGCSSVGFQLGRLPWVIRVDPKMAVGAGLSLMSLLALKEEEGTMSLGKQVASRG